MYQQFIFGYTCGALSVVLLMIVGILFYSNPVKRQAEQDRKDDDRFRFRRNQFNYMDNVGSPVQYSDHMK